MSSSSSSFTPATWRSTRPRRALRFSSARYRVGKAGDGSCLATSEVIVMPRA